jgi:hypothetical protein
MVRDTPHPTHRSSSTLARCPSASRHDVN